MNEREYIANLWSHLGSKYQQKIVELSRDQNGSKIIVYEQYDRPLVTIYLTKINDSIFLVVKNELDGFTAFNKITDLNHEKN